MVRPQEGGGGGEGVIREGGGGLISNHRGLVFSTFHHTNN